MAEWKILILEDEISLAYTLSAALEKNLGAGTVVKISTSAEAALQVMQAHRFDLIISDYKLPGISGLDFITQVRQTLSDVPIIFITAFGSNDIAKQAQKISDYYIEKPFEVSNLTYAVHQLLGMNQAGMTSNPLQSKKDMWQPSRHILVLEDDEGLLNLYCKVFQKSGFNVHTAQSIQAANDLLSSQKFDVFICDVRIGKTFGVDLLLIWRDKLIQNNTKIIVASGDPWYRLMSEKIGADFFFQKPVEMATLVNLAKGLTDSRSQDHDPVKERRR